MADLYLASDAVYYVLLQFSPLLLVGLLLIYLSLGRMIPIDPNQFWR